MFRASGYECPIETALLVKIDVQRVELRRRRRLGFSREQIRDRRLGAMPAQPAKIFARVDRSFASNRIARSAK